MRLKKYFDTLLFNYGKKCLENEASDNYCEFLDQLSDCVDDMIQNSEDEKLMNDALKLYFRHNELYFSDVDEKDCIKYLIDDFECFPDILNYEYNLIIVCNVCNGNGDLPECPNCGKTEIIYGNCPYCNKDTFVQGGYCEDCNRWYDEYEEEYKQTKDKYKCDVCLDEGQKFGCSKCNKVDPEKCKECHKNFSFNNIYCRTCLEKIKNELKWHAKVNGCDKDNSIYCDQCKCNIQSDMYEQHQYFVHKYKSHDIKL